MSDKHYIGIDESNNGMPRVIHVGVKTDKLRDIIKSRDPVKEKARPKEFDLETLNDYDFRFLIADPEFLKEFKKHKSYFIIINEFLDAFPNSDAMIIDGGSKGDFYRELKTLRRGRVPPITFEPKGDVNYPILRTADQIAYVLFQHVFDRLPPDQQTLTKEQEKKMENLGLGDLIIKPDLQKYRAFFDEFENKHRRNSRNRVSYVNIPQAMRGAYSY